MSAMLKCAQPRNIGRKEVKRYNIFSGLVNCLKNFELYKIYIAIIVS
jgi:hypothetical protein